MTLTTSTTATADESGSTAGPSVLLRKAPPGPRLTSPRNGARLAQPASPPLLQWRPSRGAESYQVEIDTAERDWVETETYETETTAFVVPPQQPGKYWWRVRTELGDGRYSRVSKPRSYIVQPLPRLGRGDARLVDDYTTDSHVEDVVFDWKPMPGAVSYDIRVSTDDDFNTIIDKREVLGTRYSPEETYDNTNYWWQVRSRDIFGQAEEWDSVPVRTFQRAWLETPTLLTPADRREVGDDLYYQWEPVRKAARYRLDVGTDPNFSSSKSFETCYTTQTTYTPGFEESPKDDDCMPAPGQTTFWRVQALDDPEKVNGVLSEVHAFVYNPRLVVQTYPGAGQTVTVPTLKWQPSDDAVAYKVRLTRPDGRVIEAETHSYSWTPTGTKQLPVGDYSWTVQAVDQNKGVSPQPLTERRFTLAEGQPSGSALVPKPSAAGTRFPALEWGAHPDATHYRIKVADSEFSTFFMDLDENFAYPAGTDTEDTYLQPGNYSYFVEAWDGRSKIAQGPTGTFTVTELAPVTGQRIAMDGSGLDKGTTCKKSLSSGGICENTRATPVLDWEPVEGAGLYMVYLSYDKELTNLVYGNKADPKSLPKTQNTRWVPHEALPESQAGGAYYWYVRPCTTAASCAEDPRAATHAFRKKSNPVELSGPRHGAVVANDITFAWTDYLATNQSGKGINAETREANGQAARGYRLEVATNPAFTKPIDIVEVDQKTYTPYSDTYPEGTLYWRVQALDGSENGLTWSQTRKLVKRSPKPALTWPRNNARTGSTPPFSWRPLTFAASYEIEVYANGDRNASSRNRVIREESKQVAYAHDEALPASRKPYVWRVRRIDADGREGAWSIWRSFYVKRRR